MVYFHRFVHCAGPVFVLLRSSRTTGIHPCRNIGSRVATGNREDGFRMQPGRDDRPLTYALNGFCMFSESPRTMLDGVIRMDSAQTPDNSSQPIYRQYDATMADS